MSARVIPILTKAQAKVINGGLTSTSKMPCKSYSLPTAACKTGAKMSVIAGSICSMCYADKGFYAMYAMTIQPAQHARLVSLDDPLWVSSMVASIGTDQYFRWHDSGDLQSVDHLYLIAQVCEGTPNTKHWLPTREYSMIKEYLLKHGALPANLSVRLSAMYPDKPVIIPASLQNVAGITASNVHTHGATVHGKPCPAPSQGGACGDCRACWARDTVVSYTAH